MHPRPHKGTGLRDPHIHTHRLNANHKTNKAAKRYDESCVLRSFASAHPLALKDDWSLRHVQPVMTPPVQIKTSSHQFLPAVWPDHRYGSVRGQARSCPYWLGCSLQSDYLQIVVLHVHHKAVRRVYPVPPWYAENTMRMAYAVAHRLPCTQTQAWKKILHWLQDNAAWEEGEEGRRCTDKVIPREF